MNYHKHFKIHLQMKFLFLYYNKIQFLESKSFKAPMNQKFKIKILLMMNLK